VVNGYRHQSLSSASPPAAHPCTPSPSNPSPSPTPFLTPPYLSPLQHFTKSGYLFPTFNSFYWIGLRTQAWPDFMFIDRAEAMEGYMHWGTIPNGPNEPNNINGSEFCAGANYTEYHGGAWGWSDELCTLRAPFMCKIRREPASRPAAAVRCRACLV
jgi:hypothetical protein